MPNWCLNNLYLSGDADQIQQFIRDAQGPKEALDFEKMLPCPEELQNTRSPVTIVTAAEREKAITELGDQKFQLPITQEMSDDYSARFEADNWYAWCTHHWGCKWSPSDTCLTPEGCYSFDTAWAPPTEFFLNISPRYPNVLFKLEFYEPGMVILGSEEIQNGGMLAQSELSRESTEGRRIMTEFGFDPESENQDE